MAATKNAGKKTAQSAGARRDRILDAALKVFVERGYEGTSMDGVADAAGVARRTVYNQFPEGKESLFRMVVTRVWTGFPIVDITMTPRDLQSKHKQWFIGKSLDTFCPLGPWLVTADKIDPANLQIICWVNGEPRQNANTSEMIFDVPTLIETLSPCLTLLPGDVIATGTPAGVGIGFNPPRYLARGDEISMGISGVGRLVNKLL
jgi:hypothetical protein